MRVLPAGADGVIAECDDLAAALGLYRSLEADPLPGVLELVPAARTVYVRFSPVRTARERIAAGLRARESVPAAASAGELVRIPVVYDGEDLAEVAELAGMGTDELVALHAAGEYEVAFTGFAPGFAYLSGLDPRLHVPRRETPRTAIPAGALGVAGEFTGVYPRSSPGGWRLIGRALADMWDVRRDPPALLQPGMRVRFEPMRPRSVHLGDAAAEGVRAGGVAAEGVDASGAGAGEVGAHSAAAGELPHRPTPAGAGSRGVEILAPGPQSLVQDLGRPGLARFGVAASGAMDRAALRRANRLVGNRPGAAAIEATFGGLVLRARGPLTIAVTGAVPPITVADPVGGVREEASERPFALAAGEELSLGTPERGTYTYVAIRGGLAVDPVLGSASRDVLSGLGPDPLRPGDVLPIGDGAGAAVQPWPDPVDDAPAAGETVMIGIHRGPRDDWFTSDALRVLVEQSWAVTPHSNRVGLRLAGNAPLERAVTGELPSEATPAGALQVPPSGQPVLFCADHPLTGGYPVIGVVPERELARAAQVPPGGLIRFRLLP